MRTSETIRESLSSLGHIMAGQCLHMSLHGPQGRMARSHMTFTPPSSRGHKRIQVLACPISTSKSMLLTAATPELQAGIMRRATRAALWTTTTMRLVWSPKCIPPTRTGHGRSQHGSSLKTFHSQPTGQARDYQTPRWMTLGTGAGDSKGECKLRMLVECPAQQAFQARRLQAYTATTHQVFSPAVTGIVVRHGYRDCQFKDSNSQT